MKKVLFIASVASMIDQFNMSNIKLLQTCGYEVHVAANFILGNTSSDERLEKFKKELVQRKVKYYQVNFVRNPISILQNYQAYKKIKQIILVNKYELLHCQSPIGGMIGRLAARNINNIKIIYTAHGFHFYNGAPILNWLLYYPVECILARFTDKLITINSEDYIRAKSFKLRNNGQLYYVPGVGVETKKYQNITIDREAKRKVLGIGEKSLIVLSVGELNKNKNHETALRALAKIKNKDFVYLICGKGKLLERLQSLSEELGIASKVVFLGYRTDIGEIYNVADIFLFPSYREGLSVAIMEAIVAGLPVVCSDIRGNTDLIKNCKNGYLVKPYDIKGFTEKLNVLMNSPSLQKKFQEYNVPFIQNYDSQHITDLMKNIYLEQE